MKYLNLTQLAVATYLMLGGVQPALANDTHDQAHDPRYPAEWWQEVSPEGAPEWEILPQEAAPGEVILSKRTELGILSNFAATPFIFHGVQYASLEGFWQAMKYPEDLQDQQDPRTQIEGVVWPYTRAEVAAMSAFAAKDAGNFGSTIMTRLGINWVTFEGQRLPYRVLEKGAHYDLIVAATWAKLEQNPEVRAILLKTGDLILKPDHKQEANTPPAWEYFKIYMDIREQLTR